MQSTEANASPRCAHVHDGGQPCGSPALRDHDFCYYHERLHHPAPHPVKTPVAFLPPLESPEAIQIAATNIARAVGMGHLTDKQARNMNASLRMARWALEQRAKAAAEGNQPDPVTDLPDAMARVLTSAHTEVESSSVMLNDDARPSAGPRQHPPQPQRPKPSNILPSDLSLPLNDEQIAYCRSVLRYGPSHPHFHDCSRRVDKLISAHSS